MRSRNTPPSQAIAGLELELRPLAPESFSTGRTDSPRIACSEKRCSLTTITNSIWHGWTLPKETCKSARPTLLSFTCSARQPAPKQNNVRYRKTGPSVHLSTVEDVPIPMMRAHPMERAYAELCSPQASANHPASSNHQHHQTLLIRDH